MDKINQGIEKYIQLFKDKAGSFVAGMIVMCLPFYLYYKDSQDQIKFYESNRVKLVDEKNKLYAYSLKQDSICTSRKNTETLELFDKFKDLMGDNSRNVSRDISNANMNLDKLDNMSKSNKQMLTEASELSKTLSHEK